MSQYVPTVDQIAQDQLTLISHKYWSPADYETAQELHAYDPNLIEDIYKSELVKSKFNLRRIMLLEFSQYLENYLWKNFDSEKATSAHIMSIVIMLNEKFRERVFAWQAVRDAPTHFSGFFERVLRLTLDAKTMSCAERTILVKFLDNCVNSLEVDLVRAQVQKICGLPMWISICDNRREYEFKKFNQLKKFWKAITKNDAKLSEAELTRVHFQRTFLKRFIDEFIATLNLFESTPPQGMETGEVVDALGAREQQQLLRYLERSLELIIDLEALLPTRSFFNTLLDDSQLLIHCSMSSLVQQYNSAEPGTCTKSRLFCQLLATLKFYTTFEIDDQTGEAKSEAQVQELHYEKLRELQKGVFKYFREDLQTFALTNIATIDKRETLIKHLESLSVERLYALAEYLHLVPFKTQDNEQSKKYDKQLLLEIIISHMTRRASQIDTLNEMPLYPTEEILWDENQVPADYSQQDNCLSLPKLNLQFLTLHDYLLRNFNLFRLEAAYEIRNDIEDACIRMRPYYSYEEQCTSFGSWARMAQPITAFSIVEVAKPNVGEWAPARVRADLSVNLECLRPEYKLEWDELRKHDIGFLVTLRPTNTPEQRYSRAEPFLAQMNVVAVRGCEIEGMLNEDGRLIGEDSQHPANRDKKPKFTTDKRTFRISLDANQYKLDSDKLATNPGSEDIYMTFNLFVRRKPKENNFKAILESIRDLMNTHFVVPNWLRDLLLGYGDPAAANYKQLKQPAPKPTLDFNDTFLSYEHLCASFPNMEVKLDPSAAQREPVPPFQLTFTDLVPDAEVTEERPTLFVTPYKQPNRGPYVFNQPRHNTVRFTPTQIEAIKSGMQPGLTIVVGPPGTGKTDVAVQIIANIYRNFPKQKTLIVTHSNQALNQLFEKIMCLDIDERHLLRLGHGEEELETEKDFSRYGRVNYVLAKRLQILDEVERMQKCVDDVQAEGASYSCETAIHFYLNFMLPKWDAFLVKMKQLKESGGPIDLETIQTHFPFKNYFADVSATLFKKVSFEEDLEAAKGCFRYIKKMFKQLEEFRAFELIRNGADRAEYLLVKEAKIVAMTCTHAALKRRDLVKFNFTYDNILMEEAAQILEIETFIPLLLQEPDHNGANRLKRWIMIGDHHQLPPVIKNMAFQKYSNMEQSLFTRFVKLGIPTIDLDAQGRARPSLAELYSWRYKQLGNLEHVYKRAEFQRANPGFAFDYQLINVDDFDGKGETEPQPFFYQNLAEAEYIIAVFTYMRFIGYPADKITILTTYNGQKHLLRTVLRQRCGNNELLGEPKKITTVDKYQGQQNDYILLSLVKTRNIGHLRDVRRLVVAMSRARLGLYVFGRVKLFRSCFELTPVFNILTQRPTNLQLYPKETYSTERPVGTANEEKAHIIGSMPEMLHFVLDMYNAKLQMWTKLQQREQVEKERERKEAERLKLNEEEVLLRRKLDEVIERSEESKRLRINILGKEDGSSSSSSEEEEVDDVKVNEEVTVTAETETSEKTRDTEMRETEEAAESSPAEESEESETVEDN